MQLSQDRFPRTQRLHHSNGVPVIALPKADSPGSGPPSAAREKTLLAPAYVEFDKKVLCFHAFQEEDVTSFPAEAARVHFVKILFYLENDTIQVLPPSYCRHVL